jgi:hypothetical protein
MVDQDGKTYILETLLLKDGKQEPGHGIVVGRHDGQRFMVLESIDRIFSGRQTSKSKKKSPSDDDKRPLGSW